MLPFFAWKIFSISFFISLDFYLQVLLNRRIGKPCAAFVGIVQCAFQSGVGRFGILPYRFRGSFVEKRDFMIAVFQSRREGIRFSVLLFRGKAACWIIS